MIDKLAFKKAKELEETKANKEQEEWFELTLLEGRTGKVEIMKDEFGFVHLRGSASVGGVYYFNLPTGYRPESGTSARYIQSQGPNARTRTVRLRDNDVVDDGGQSGELEHVYFDGIIFRAVR